MIPALKLLADPYIEDVRPIILQSVTDNEFSVETCVNICSQIVKTKQQKELMEFNKPQNILRADTELVDS